MIVCRIHPVPILAALCLSLLGSLSCPVGLAQSTARLPIGFPVADADSDGRISPAEMTAYLSARLDQRPLPYARIFSGIDKDEDGWISEPEFGGRHAVLEQILREAEEMPVPLDPGPGFVLFEAADRPVDDGQIYGAVYHRYFELLQRPADWNLAGWQRIDLDQVPSRLTAKLPQWTGPRPTVDQLCQATLVIAGGGSDEMFFTGGAVIISPDGLALTNFHIAEAFNEKLLGLTAAGQPVRVVRLLAGNRDSDVALIQLEGSGFPWVPLSDQPPAMGSELVMVHHSENRFFTFDRGYVKRHPRVRGQPWMEISADYAPGGSGCGIFDSEHRLAGLVSMIVAGDGPMIAEQDFSEEEEPAGDGDGTEEDSGEMLEMGSLIVKLAVPYQAIQDLLRGESGENGAGRK